MKFLRKKWENIAKSFPKVTPGQDSPNNSFYVKIHREIQRPLGGLELRVGSKHIAVYANYIGLSVKVSLYVMI